MAMAARALAGAKVTKTRAKVPTSKLIVEQRQGVRQAKAIETHRTNERARLRNYDTIESVAQEKQILAARTREYRGRRAEQSLQTSAQQGRNRTYGAVSNATAPVRHGLNGILLIIVTMFGLIVVYALVTHPSPTSGFLNRLSTFFAALSTNAPLFETTAPSTTSTTTMSGTTTTVGGTTTSGGTSSSGQIA